MPVGIRVVVEDDLPEVVALYSHVYPNVDPSRLAGHADYLRMLLFEHPWSSSSIPSLGYEDSNGRLIGLLGVIPRPMLFKGQRIYLAISHNYMVDPTSRTTLAGVSLIKAFLSGGQRLSLCQPQGKLTRKIIKTFGATAVVLQGLSWVWPLRPAAYLVDRLRERHVSAILASAMQPVSWLIDKATRPILNGEKRTGLSQYREEDLSLEQLLDCINESSQQYALQPEFDLYTLNWLWNTILQKKHHGDLRKRGVWTSAGEQIGYYIYYAKPNGVSHVLQIGARAGAFAAVLDNLAEDAMQSGTVALSGWLDARYIEEISSKAFYLKHRRDDPLWTQTRDSAVQVSLEKGEAFLSPLESEWWTWFPDTGNSQ